MNLPNLSASAASDTTELFDIRQILQVLLCAKWRILLFTLSCVIMTIFVLLNTAPVYRATSTLLIEAQQARAIKIDEVYGFNSMQQEYYLTQFEVLKSRSIAAEVFDELQVSQHPQYQSRPSAMSKLKALLNINSDKAPPPDPEYQKYLVRKGQLDKFVNNLSVVPVRRTQLVQIRFSSQDPRLAQAVADSLGNAYINSQLSARFGITQKANNWLGGRVAELRERLEQSELKLEAFRAVNNLVDVAGITALDKRELENLNEQLGEARARNAESQSFLNLIRQFKQDDIARLESLQEITSHPSVQNVKREVLIAERKVVELSNTYGAKHPRMIAANAELATVQQSLRDQILRLMDGVDKEAQAAAQRLEALELRFEALRSRFSGLGGLEADYRRLEREVETNRLLYENFMSRQKETEVSSGFDAPIARFTDLAQLPTVPIKPNKKMTVLLVVFVATGFAMVLVLLTDAFNDTIKSTQDIEKVLKQRALGYLPRINKKLKDNILARLFFSEAHRLYREEAQNIRTSLFLLTLNSEIKTLLITSSVPEEGKTSVALNLGYAFGLLERVLVIEADMRKPTMCEKLNYPLYQSGLANILAGTAQFSECVVRDEETKIDVLTAGAVSLNPLELQASERMRGLLNELKQQYDRIIIDTPPVQAVSDALQLVSLSDAVLMVVKADKTRTAVINNTLARINQAHGNVCGVVLNQMDVSRAVYYRRYDYSCKPTAAH